mgnify:CR=1 FL=1
MSKLIRLRGSVMINYWPLPHIAQVNHVEVIKSLLWYSCTFFLFYEEREYLVILMSLWCHHISVYVGHTREGVVRVKTLLIVPRNQYVASESLECTGRKLQTVFHVNVIIIWTSEISHNCLLTLPYYDLSRSTVRRPPLPVWLLRAT